MSDSDLLDKLIDRLRNWEDFDSAESAAAADAITALRQERDNWQALAAAADADKRKAQDNADKFRLLYGEAMDALKERSDEVDALRHDIARHVAICAEQAKEIEKLREGLLRCKERLEWLEPSKPTILLTYIQAVLSREGK